MHRLKSSVSGVIKNSFCFLALIGWSAQAGTELNWSSPSSLPTMEHLMCVAYGNGFYVTVGFNGTILTSVNGSEWADRSATSGVILSGVCAGNGSFVAVGEGGTILFSADGVNWDSQTSPVTDDLKSVIWNGTLFVAVGLAGTIITSENGVDWTKQDFKSGTDLSSVTWGNSEFVAVGFDGMAGTISTSPDGIVWLDNQYYGSEGFFSVSWFKTKIIAGSYPMFSSSDGLTWSEISAETDEYIVGLAASNDLVVAVGGNGTILSSPDGITWTTVSTEVSNALNSVASDGVKFVAIGMNGTIIYSSTSNAINHRLLSSSLNKELFSVNRTTMYFTLQNNVDLRIDLFSPLGKHIKTLVSGNVSKGFHQIDFSRGLSAGNYVLSFKNDGLSNQRLVAVSK